MRAGPALDWKVAKTLGIDVEEREDGPYHNGVPYNPSSNWEIGGPFIDEYSLEVEHIENKYEPRFVRFCFNRHGHSGDTVLAAVCTAIVQEVTSKGMDDSRCPYGYEDSLSMAIEDEQWVVDHPGYDLNFRDIMSEYIEVGREEVEKQLNVLEECVGGKGYTKAILFRIDCYIEKYGEMV